MFYTVLKELCDKDGSSPTRVCEHLGIPRGTLSYWKNKKNFTPKGETLQKIADYFNVSVDYLLSENPHNSDVEELIELNKMMNDPIFVVDETPKIKIKPAPKNKIPVLGSVRAGHPMYAEENIIDYEEISNEMAKDGEHYALRIKGDSMTPRFIEGDVVIIKKCPIVENGEIAIVMVGNDEATIKKFYKTAVGVQLVATNPNFPAMTFTPEEVDTLPVSVIGKVVELRARF